MTGNLTVKGVLVVGVAISLVGCRPSASDKFPSEIDKLGGRLIPWGVTPENEPLFSVDWPKTATDAQLERLRDAKGVSQLRTLSIAGSQVTDAGLKHLKGLTQLEELSLQGTQVTGAGLEHLKGLTQLRLLDLRDTQVTGAGPVNLKGLAQLQILDLRDTQVTDAGLANLKGLTRLWVLCLQGTQVTYTGCAELKKRLPKLKIVHSDSPTN